MTELFKHGFFKKRKTLLQYLPIKYLFDINIAGEPISCSQQVTRQDVNTCRSLPLFVAVTSGIHDLFLHFSSLTPSTIS